MTSDQFEEFDREMTIIMFSLVAIAVKVCFFM
jgi:hypothetical protein